MPAAVSADLKTRSSARRQPAWFSGGKASGTSLLFFLFFFPFSDYFSYGRVMVSLPTLPHPLPSGAHTEHEYLAFNCIKLEGPKRRRSKKERAH